MAGDFWKVLIVFTLLILSGCAMHPPMSELLMFQEKKTGDRTYDAKYSHALGSYSINFLDKAKVNNYARENYEYFEKGESPAYEREHAFATHGIFLEDTTGTFGLSVGVGSGLIVDITARPYKDYYITGSTVLKKEQLFSGQLILQKRLINNENIGLSSGLVLNRNDVEVSLEGGGNECTICYPSARLTTYSAGVRGVLLWPGRSKYGDSRGFIYLSGSLNYDFNIEDFYPRISIALGIY